LDWIVQSDTVVRPDVMVVCGAQPKRHLEKPPVLTIEILSESTADKDRHAKRELYENNRVKHYVIADVSEKSLQWLELQSDGKYEDVSTRISNGQFCMSLEDGCDIRIECKSAFG
jgi:Uma2 family endonuclease